MVQASSLNPPPPHPFVLVGGSGSSPRPMWPLECGRVCSSFWLPLPPLRTWLFRDTRQPIPVAVRHKTIKIWKRKRAAARIPGVSGGMARSRLKVGDCLADSDVATPLHIRLTKRLGLLFCAVASRHGPRFSVSRRFRSH